MNTQEKDNLIIFGPLPPPVNGHTLAFRVFIDALEKNGCRFKLINYSPSSISKAGLSGNIPRVIEYFFILLKFLIAVCSSQAGIVYITLNQSLDGAVRDFFLILLGKMFGHRVFVHIHGGMYDKVLDRLPRFFLKAMTRALGKCSGIIILSELFKDDFRRFPEFVSKLMVVENGLPGIFEELPVIIGKKLPGPEQPVKLIFLSNMLESKGWVEALNALNILINDKKQKVKMFFCGPFQCEKDGKFKSENEARQNFDNYVKQHGLADSVEYFAFVDGELKNSLLAQSHFMIFPSAYPNEGQPLVLIEGLANGCVLMSTRYRAIPDMLIDDKTGLFVEKCPDSIAEAVFSLILNPEKYAQMSQNTVDLYNAEFTREKHTDKLLKNVLTS